MAWFESVSLAANLSGLTTVDHCDPSGTDIRTPWPTFTPGNNSPDAIKVVLHRSSDNNNPLGLFFARVLGHNTAGVSAAAIATGPSEGQGPQFRFLLDDEMFDTDVPSIEDLADSLQVDPEDLLSDGDGDGFIDIPGGSTLELPTGQVGDEGIFDRSRYENDFPFKKNSIASIEH